MNKIKLTGTVLAVSAAAMFALAPVVATAHSASKVQCEGVNKCKGHSTCKTAANACAGKNACKGKGIVKMTEAKCKKAGGTVVSNKDSNKDSNKE